MFFYGLGRLPLIGPDEPRYAEVAREMFATGDWVTPRLGGLKWFEKPALTYWLSAGGYAVFGVSEFGARVLITLAAGLSVLLLFLYGSRIVSTRYGYLSAAALATCGLWPGFARGATFDLPLAAAMELALLSFFLWESSPEPRRKNRLWYVFCFALGLAVLAKGLVGIVLPCAIVGAYLLLSGRLKIVFKPRLLLLGGLIFLATAAVWYGPVIAKNGREFIDEFFIAHHFQRYLSNKYKHPQPFYFFFGVLLAGSFPWTFFLISNAWQSVKRWKTAGAMSGDRFGLFLWLWVLIPLIFFSFSGSKLPGYILPVFPAIALIVGRELECWWAGEEPRRMKFLAVLTVFLIFAAGLIVGLGAEGALGIDLYDAFRVATIAIITAVGYLALWFFLGGRTATIFLPFGMAVVMIATVNVIFPALGERESLREVALEAKRNARPGERLVFYVNHDHGINFYATELPLRDERSELTTAASPEETLKLIEAHGGQSILVLSRRRWSGGVANSRGLAAQTLAEQRGSTRCSPDCDWVLLRVTRASR